MTLPDDFGGHFEACAAPEDPASAAPAPPIQGLRHLAVQGVPALDSDRAIRFWTEVFGLRLLEDHPLGVTRWTLFEIPGAQTRLALMPMAEPPRTAIPALVFAVEALEAALAQLEHRGARILRGPRTAEWTEAARTALVEDSEGNVIMLTTDMRP